MNPENSGLRVSSAFDGGNIECLAADRASAIRLAIKPDNQSHFYQWFYFRLTGARDQECRMVIENAAGAAFVAGWESYEAVASYDREEWFRVPTTYADGQLTINHTPELDSIYYAYFAPYPMERHADLIASAVTTGDAALEVIGSTLDGQDLDLLTIGDAGPDKLTYWVTARQHPGETMAEFWMEGFLERLLDNDDPVARTLKNQVVFKVVPNMNPDGSQRGHLRTNAAGVNLNREWHEPSLEKSPEVFQVLNRMAEQGIDFALDVHGDEGLPYVFIAGGEGAPNFDERDAGLLSSFKSALERASPDFQTKEGYPVVAPGKADLRICTNQLVERFRCLAMTLEMPFKDNVNLPDAEYGWSPERSRKLGAACLDAMLAVVDQLRG